MSAANAGELARKFDELLARLLEDTSASRTTLRLDDAALGLQVDDVAGEARGAAVKSLRGQTAMDQRRLATVEWLERERRPLIQPDLSNSDIPAPPPLVAVYGVQAQMLGPVVRHGLLQGWVSVHVCDTPRDWSPADILRLERAVSEVKVLLDAAEGA